jgi:sulfate adenylyltransferase
VSHRSFRTYGVRTDNRSSSILRHRATALSKNTASPSRRGFTLFLTGLSGAGKSTVALKLAEFIEREHGRPVTRLDGDVVREMLSSGLTFSRADRELNLRRIGSVAGEVTRHGGICVCAVIAPYASARAEARSRIEGFGRFYEIHVSTPLAVCETRDTKGLYARARRGELRGMTGIDDPFEVPASPDLSIDASRLTVDEEVRRIVALPQRDGLL